MSTPTPMDRVLMIVNGLSALGEHAQRAIVQAALEVEAVARKDERATCARIVKSGIHCGAPPESIAAMMNAGADPEPKPPPLPDRVLVSRAALVYALAGDGVDLVEEHRTHIEGVLWDTRGRTAACGVPALRALLDLMSRGGAADPEAYMAERALQAAFLEAGLPL